MLSFDFVRFREALHGLSVISNTPVGQASLPQQIGILITATLSSVAFRLLALVYLFATPSLLGSAKQGTYSRFPNIPSSGSPYKVLYHLGLGSKLPESLDCLPRIDDNQSLSSSAGGHIQPVKEVFHGQSSITFLQIRVTSQ